jgi:histidinol-phosphate aminotransferase
MDIRRLVRPNVRKLRAYEAKEIPAKVKLDANESPYGFRLNLKGIETNRYPDPEAKRLRTAFAKQAGVRAGNVLAGNGSDELIYYLITAFGGPVLYPTPTFSMYEIIAKAIGVKTIGIPLDTDFDLDMKKMLPAVRKQKPRLIFLSSPNNPTGNCFSTDRILQLVEASKGLVVVDEAYHAFAGGKGFTVFLKDYDNLIVMRTLSKTGLAALRVGFLLGGPDIIDEVNKVRLPFNLNSLSQSAALEALKNRKRMRAYIKAIADERERLAGEMDGISSVKIFPSEANFIMFRVKDPDRVHKGLLRRGVLVRDISGMIKNCLRVTVGTKKENNAFLKALKETFKKNGKN